METVYKFNTFITPITKPCSSRFKRLAMCSKRFAIVILAISVFLKKRPGAEAPSQTRARDSKAPESPRKKLRRRRWRSARR